MYRWIEHTGELELLVEGRSAEEALGEALVAFGELVGEGREGEHVTHELWLEAPDRPALLAEWLNELVYLAETDGFVPERVEELQLGESGLRARVSGVRSWPRNLVKAVTYHRLEFRDAGDIWLGRVTLDV